MRSFEIVIIVMLAFSGILICFHKKDSKWFNVAAAFTVILFLLQIGIEKYRWQMIPAYGLSGFVFLLSILNMFSKDLKEKKSIKRKTLLRLFGIAIYFIWLGGAAILPYVLTLASLKLDEAGRSEYQKTESHRAQALQRAIAIHQGEVVDDVLRQELNI